MKSLASLFLILVASGPSSTEANSSYERLLQKQKIAVTTEGIREYLRSLKSQYISPQRIVELIRQMGDDSFEKREAATKALGELPILPVEELKKAAEGKDAEIRFRAKQILSGKQFVRPPITYAVLRMIQLKPIKGLAADLLAILPLIEKHHLEVAVREALRATMEPKDEIILKQALQSDSQKVRMAAQAVLEILRKDDDSGKGADDFLYQGLVAYFPFDGDSRDVGGFGNHGVNEGNVEYVKNGIGRSVRFHGATDQGYVRIPNSSSLRFGESATFSCWYRIEEESGFADDGTQNIVKSANHAIVSKGGDRKGIAMISLGARTIKKASGDRFHNRRISFYARNFHPQAVEMLFTPRKSSGRWVHVAVVMGKAGASLYHNGQRVAVTKKPVDLRIGNQEPVYVGIMHALRRFWYPIDGYVDELRIYNRSLKSEEIQKIYKYDLAESIDMKVLQEFGSVEIHLDSDDGVFTVVSLKNSSISDASLKSLLRFDRLKALDLSGTKITDDGLQHLMGLQDLEKVNLLKTGVTGEGLKKLRQVFPECLIER